MSWLWIYSYLPGQVATEPTQRKGSGWFMTGETILGVVMAPMTVCRERVDRYGMGF
jgi:hypothetical protein